MSEKKSIDKSCDRQTVEDITRRSALKGIACSGAAGAVALSSLSIADGAPVGNTKIDAMTLEHWNHLIGQRFDVSGPVYVEQINGVGAELRLEQVIENKWIERKDRNRPKQFRKPSFSLLFSANRQIPNATYSVGHHQLGKSHLFVHEVPRADFPDKKIYEIVLN